MARLPSLIPVPLVVERYLSAGLKSMATMKASVTPSRGRCTTKCRGTYRKLADPRWQAQVRNEWWPHYVNVNQRFVNALATATPGSHVWVHDYQLQLVPSQLRNQRPDLPVGFFLHIPFPEYSVLAQVPHHEELVKGMLGSDLIGFQTPPDHANFLDAVRQLVEQANRRCDSPGRCRHRCPSFCRSVLTAHRALPARWVRRGTSAEPSAVGSGQGEDCGFGARHGG